MTEAELNALLTKTRGLAARGEYELFKTSAHLTARRSIRNGWVESLLTYSGSRLRVRSRAQTETVCGCLLLDSSCRKTYCRMPPFA
jgi:hypothetical protein